MVRQYISDIDVEILKLLKGADQPMDLLTVINGTKTLLKKKNVALDVARTSVITHLQRLANRCEVMFVGDSCIPEPDNRRRRGSRIIVYDRWGEHFDNKLDRMIEALKQHRPDAFTNLKKKVESQP